MFGGWLGYHWWNPIITWAVEKNLSCLFGLIIWETAPPRSLGTYGNPIIKLSGLKDCISCHGGAIPVVKSWTPIITLPETNSSPLQMDGWNTTFLLGRPIFTGYVSLLEGIPKSEWFSHVSPLFNHGTNGQQSKSLKDVRFWGNQYSQSSSGSINEI